MRHAFKYAALLCPMLCAGCGTLEYQGASPSFRTMNDGLRMDDYYVGANASFAVVDPGERAAPAAVVSRREPLDVWNPPVKDAATATATATAGDEATASINSDGK
jgi:hypothetical protein